jgi:hypothetical protein
MQGNHIPHSGRTLVSHHLYGLLKSDDTAMQVPGRPLRYVVKQIQRIYDPRARQGKWTEKEDAALKR